MFLMELKDDNFLEGVSDHFGKILRVENNVRV